MYTYIVWLFAPQIFTVQLHLCLIHKKDITRIMVACSLRCYCPLHDNNLISAWCCLGPSLQTLSSYWLPGFPLRPVIKYFSDKGKSQYRQICLISLFQSCKTDTVGVRNWYLDFTVYCSFDSAPPHAAAYVVIYSTNAWKWNDEGVYHLICLTLHRLLLDLSFVPWYYRLYKFSLVPVSK